MVVSALPWDQSFPPAPPQPFGHKAVKKRFLFLCTALFVNSFVPLLFSALGFRPGSPSALNHFCSALAEILLLSLHCKALASSPVGSCLFLCTLTIPDYGLSCEGQRKGLQTAVGSEAALCMGGFSWAGDQLSLGRAGRLSLLQPLAPPGWQERIAGG